jgi:RNA polymerase sigma factor (sigma-70 family)
MVQAVCRRVLGRSDEVDDAFQATFLVLLRQARSIRRRESLAGWLHRVALRVAQRCRRASFARLRREHVAARNEALPPARTDELDLGPLLHAEIDRLPERLRGPFVLCVLEGKTNEEAARLLGVPHGTILSRLSRARERLRQRLVRRGVTAAAVTAATAAAVEPVSAAVVDTAVREALNDITGTAAAGPAAALAQGVIHAMVIRKLTIATAGVIAASLVLGLGASSAPRLLAPARAQDKQVAGKPAEPAPAPKDADTEQPKKSEEAKPEAPANQSPLEMLLPKKPLRAVHEDEIALIGTWKVAEVTVDGEKRDPEDMNIVFGPFGTMLIADDSGKPAKPMKFKLNPGATPTIELTTNGKTQKGIYQFTANELQLCLARSGEVPTGYSAAKGSDQVLFTLRLLHGNADTQWANALFVKGRSHDFGPLKSGERASYKFVVKNVYDRPIMISALPNVRAEIPMGAGMGAGGGPLGPGGAGVGGPPGGVPAAGGGVPMGPVGPMGAGPPGSGAPGGFGPGGFGPGEPYWVSLGAVPTGWLQPGEETAIEVVAINSNTPMPKIIIDVTFQVRGMERGRGPRGGGRVNRGGGFGPMGPGGEQTQPIGHSTVELTLTAGSKPG